MIIQTHNSSSNWLWCCFVVNLIVKSHTLYAQKTPDKWIRHAQGLIVQ